MARELINWLPPPPHHFFWDGDDEGREKGREKIECVNRIV